MLTVSLDTIVRRNLLEAGLPIHWYSEYLFHSSACLRELTFDTLKIINSANLPLSLTGTLQLPEDFVDDIAVAFPYGNSLTKFPRQDWITPLQLHDSVTGAYVPFGTSPATNDNEIFGFPSTWNWFYGGYGSSGGTSSGYQVFRQRGQIQFTENFIGTDSMVLLYISDGQSVDNASQVSPMAFACIQSYVNWKKSPNRDNDNSPEGRSFYNQKRLLRARLSDLDIATLKNIVRDSYKATVKN